MTLQQDVSFVISAPTVSQGNGQSLLALLNHAKSRACPSVSQFYVGAIAIGQSGQAYLGTNLEFLNQPLSQTVHAEQFAIALARHHGEVGITHIVVSEMPCGHCRQFLLELGNLALPLTIVQGDRWLDLTLQDLLPHPFTLASADRGILVSQPASLRLDEDTGDDELAKEALKAATKAYVPYTRAYSGAAIRVANGTVYVGSAIESAAFNPSLPAMQAALIQLVAGGNDFREIRDVVLVESAGAGPSFVGSTEQLIAALSSNAKIRCYTALSSVL
jgi:cytidine deaminase